MITTAQGLEETLKRSAMLAGHASLIGSAALVALGAVRAPCNDVNLKWHGEETRIEEHARRAFGHKAWQWRQTPVGGTQLEAGPVHGLLSLTIMSQRAWSENAIEAERPSAACGIGIAPRETLAAMKLAALGARIDERDRTDLVELEELGTNAEDSARELLANLGEARVRAVLERTRAIRSGQHWQRGLERALGERTRHSDATLGWRLHPTYCARRRTARHVLRESAHDEDGSMTETIVADYATFEAALAAGLRADPHRPIERDASYR